MITLSQIRPGMTIMYEGKETTVIQGSYEDPSLGLMIKSSLYPGGMVADRYQLPNSGELTVIDNEPQKQTIVFKGKIVGELEETVFTPELIAERSKPLLALKIKGVFDSKGAEEVKKAITKAVKMRTAVEGIEEPIIKNINSQAKKAVAAIREVSKPIYEACYATQNTLQATYDAWALEVQQAEKKAEQEELAKTVERENQMYILGLTFNGQAFVGYGKTITKNSLHSFSQEAFDSLVTELEVLQMDSEVSGLPKEAVAPVIGGAGSSFTVRQASNFDGGEVEVEPFTKYGNAIYERLLSDGTKIILHKGTIEEPAEGFQFLNERVGDSAVYCSVVGKIKFL